MVEVLYFERGGNHTQAVLDHVKPVADARQLGESRFSIIVATTSGETGVLTCKAFPKDKYNVVCVTHSDGFKSHGIQELDATNAKQIENLGGTILTATHAFSGVETGISKAMSGGVVFPVEVFALIVRKTIGDGIKVCMEIALMAADAGLIPVDQDVLCIAGTGSGADTACIIRPTYSRNFPDLKVKQILAKPEIARG